MSACHGQLPPAVRVAESSRLRLEHPVHDLRVIDEEALDVAGPASTMQRSGARWRRRRRSAAHPAGSRPRRRSRPGARVARCCAVDRTSAARPRGSRRSPSRSGPGGGSARPPGTRPPRSVLATPSSCGVVRSANSVIPAIASAISSRRAPSRSSVARVPRGRPRVRPDETCPRSARWRAGRTWPPVGGPLTVPSRAGVDPRRGGAR